MAIARARSGVSFRGIVRNYGQGASLFHPFDFCLGFGFISFPHFPRIAAQFIADYWALLN